MAGLSQRPGGWAITKAWWLGYHNGQNTSWLGYHKGLVAGLSQMACRGHITDLYAELQIRQLRIRKWLLIFFTENNASSLNNRPILLTSFFSYLDSVRFLTIRSRVADPPHTLAQVPREAKGLPAQLHIVSTSVGSPRGCQAAADRSSSSRRRRRKPTKTTLITIFPAVGPRAQTCRNLGRLYRPEHSG